MKLNSPCGSTVSNKVWHVLSKIVFNTFCWIIKKDCRRENYSYIKLLYLSQWSDVIVQHNQLPLIMVNNRESYCYVIRGGFDGSLKAYILYAVKDKQHKPRELSGKLGVSLATIYKIKKDGFECLKRKKMRASPGQPRKINTRIESGSQNPPSQKTKLHFRQTGRGMGIA